MKADTPVEKLKNSFSTGACKTLRVSHSFHRLDDNEPKTTKPDTSLATETGHFHLLLTSKRAITAPGQEGWREAPGGWLNAKHTRT